MQRSICVCEPAVALAGQVSTWKFIYTPSSALKKGAVLRFDLCSDGREIDWELPKVGSRTTNNVIYMTLPDDDVVHAKEVFPGESVFPQFEFVLPEDVKGGKKISICIGATSKTKDSDKNGNRAQAIVQRRKPFQLHIDPKGKGEFQEPEIFSLDVRGNDLKNVKILTPAYTVKNKRFDVLVRFEDEFGNLTARAPEGTIFELSYENFRENLNWKLFVPETGFIALPNFYFNEPGTYIIQLKNLLSSDIYYSAPSRCFEESEEELKLFWGLLHGESERFDSTESVESCLRFFRDDQAFNFYGLSHFEDEEELTNDLWKNTTQLVATFNEEDRFTSFMGLQWQGEKEKEGIRHFVIAKEKSLIQKKDAKSSSLKKIYKSLSPKELISVPCFTMGGEHGFDFENFTPEFERVVEIYNAWGCSECPEKSGNLYPISGPSKSDLQENKKGSIIDALNAGCRFGFVAGGLDDRGVYETFYESEQYQYTPGLTAVIGKVHSRSGIFDALYQRSCYATTGKKILLGFDIAGTEMGQEISLNQKPGLAVNRHINLFVGGTAPIDYIEIIRNGKVLTKFELKKENKQVFHLEYDDLEDLLKLFIKSDRFKSEFVYYYVRVKQVDDHMAWSSPIWIDRNTGEKKVKLKKK